MSQLRLAPRASLPALAIAIIAGCASSQRPIAPAAVAPAPAPAAPFQPLQANAANEASAEYWLARLAEPDNRELAIERLARLFEDAFTGAKRDPNAPAVRALLDATTEPLTKVYVAHHAELGRRARVELIRLLESHRDRRAEPAFRKAFKEFVKNPQAGGEETDIVWAARATEKLKLTSLAEPVLKAFEVFQVSTLLGGRAYKPLNAAMLEIASANWVEPLTARLAAPMTPPRSDQDHALFNPYRDQLFWQATAAELLGRIGDPRAVEPLLNVMIESSKVDVQATAILALVKLGRPAADGATRLLRGHESDVHVQAAALVLGTCGRADSTAALIEALKSEKNAQNRAVLARELSKLPPSAASKQAFRTAVEKLPQETALPSVGNALEHLADAAVQFYDPALAEWMLDRAAKAKGSVDALSDYRNAAIISALKVASVEQLPRIKRVLDQYGTPLERQAYQHTEAILRSCGAETTCFLDAARKVDNLRQDRQFIALKSLYMLGTLGNEQTRDELLQHLQDLTNPSIAFVATRVIDHLTPQGSPAVALRLREIVATREASENRDLRSLNAALKQALYRIEGRSR